MNKNGKIRKCFGNRGFTLIELIIVIAIMAILLGVLAPNFLRYLHQAKVARDTQLMDTVRNALVVSAMDPRVTYRTLAQHVSFDSTSDFVLSSMSEEQQEIFCEILGYSDVNAARQGILSQISAVDPFDPDDYVYVQICRDFDTEQVYTAIIGVTWSPRYHGTVYAITPEGGCPVCVADWEANSDYSVE